MDDNEIFMDRDRKKQINKIIINTENAIGLSRLKRIYMENLINKVKKVKVLNI